jgi:hypothetical protein
MLASGVKFSWYRYREKEFWKYYAQEDQHVFFTDIRNLLRQLGETEYDPSTWRLFINSSRRRSPYCFITAKYKLPYHLHTPQRTARPIYRTGVPLLSRCCILYIFFSKYKYWVF